MHISVEHYKRSCTYNIAWYGERIRESTSTAKKTYNQATIIPFTNSIIIGYVFMSSSLGSKKLEKNNTFQDYPTSAEVASAFM